MNFVLEKYIFQINSIIFLKFQCPINNAISTSNFLYDSNINVMIVLITFNNVIARFFSNL